MIRSITATILLTMIAVRVAAGEDDLATQIKALQKERLETLTRLSTIYTPAYKLGGVSGEVFADAETALVNAQVDATDNPDAIATILRAAWKREINVLQVAGDRDAPYLVESQTDYPLWSAVCSQTSVELARALNEEDQITSRQGSRIQALTEFVKEYKERYKTGTAPLEALVRAQVALLAARIDAAQKHEERVALLEEYGKSEAELFKVADSKSKASACSARSLVLDAKIRTLRELGGKDDVAAQIKAAQKERVEALTELVKIDKELWETKWAGLATLTQAKADLANARADAADTFEAKVLVLTEAAKEQAEVVRVTEARTVLDTSGADVCRERLHLLDFQIRLLRERGLQKARDL